MFRIGYWVKIMNGGEGNPHRSVFEPCWEYEVRKRKRSNCDRCIGVRIENHIEHQVILKECLGEVRLKNIKSSIRPHR